MRRSVLTFLFILTLPAFGGEVPVVITAKEVKGNVNTSVKAHGRVVVKYKDVTIEGDKGLYDREKGIIRVWGNVVIREGDTELHCKNLIYNLNTKEALLENVEGWLSRGERIKAERIKRVSEKEWIAYDGEYTPCSHKCPDWSVSAKKFKILLGESFAGKWVAFRVKEIPILVSPYLSGPIKRERKSGFLFPRFGYISKDGFIYKQPLYLVLGRSADLTLTYEKRTIDGEGKEAELRYVLGEKNRGDLTYYQLNKSDRKDWKFNLNHTYKPSDYAYGSAKAEIVSSREYYKSSSNLDTVEQSQVYTKSDVTVSKLWEHTVLNANAVYLRYLDGSADTIYQKLPSLSIYLLDSPIPKTPFTFNLFSRATYFYRKAGGSSYRVNLEPSLKLSKQIGRVKNTSELTYMYTYYQFGNSRKLWRFKNSTKVNRFYPLGSYAISVNPELTFNYVESKNQESFPLYDITDRIRGERRLSPAVELYLYGKGKRLARISAQTDYLLNGSEWKELKGDFEITPTYWLTLRETADVSPQRGGLKFLNSYAQLNLSRINLWINHYNGKEMDIQYLKWGFKLPLSPFLNFNYTQRYDLKNSTDREREYSFTMNRGCWNGEVKYRWVKNFDNTIDYQVVVLVNLIKLGSYGYKWKGKK
ncbi:MAG: LPS-assembly protein LptD [Desulfurobacteriaceae bacterium]